VLCVYGAITAAGGIFGPLYRALDMNRVALAVKLLTALVVLVPGALLVMNAGAVGGAWVVNALYALSVAGTAATTLPALRGRARTEQPA
jgi:O-antigen/teichoic acid export membrane protein